MDASVPGLKDIMLATAVSSFMFPLTTTPGLNTKAPPRSSSNTSSFLSLFLATESSIHVMFIVYGTGLVLHPGTVLTAFSLESKEGRSLCFVHGKGNKSNSKNT
jgi:hypothetical protein